MFSSMLPPEAYCRLSLCSTRAERASGENPKKLAFWSISRAHFNGRLDQEVFAEIPSELCDQYEGYVVAKLKKIWYGLQDASNMWLVDDASFLSEHGHPRGKSNGAVSGLTTTAKQLPQSQLCSDGRRRCSEQLVFEHMLVKKYTRYF